MAHSGVSLTGRLFTTTLFTAITHTGTFTWTATTPICSPRGATRTIRTTTPLLVGRSVLAGTMAGAITIGATTVGGLVFTILGTTLGTVGTHLIIGVRPGTTITITEVDGQVEVRTTGYTPPVTAM